MKKMIFSIIFILVLIMFVFAGCLSFNTPDTNGDNGDDSTTSDDYETIDAAAMNVPVTNASGETETNAAGEVVTTQVIGAPIEVSVTNASGETVTNQSGEKETTVVYMDPNSGMIINNAIGEVKPTQAYVDKNTGAVVATTVPSTTSASSKPNKPAQQTTAPTTQPPQAVANEFEYLKNGTFYIQGTMSDYSSGENLPLEMAVTPNSVYMLSQFEGADMGMLISNGTTYMIYPPEKAYLELSPTILKTMGMDTGDLISSADLNYGQYELSKADATATENVDGKNCTVYIFNNSTGSTRFYMDGTKLVRFGTYSQGGTPETINNVSYITNNVPADKINPPKNYKAYKGITGMFGFITLLGDLVQ